MEKSEDKIADEVERAVVDLRGGSLQFLWKVEDEFARNRIHIETIELGGFARQLDDDSVWVAVATGAGSDRWVKVINPAGHFPYWGN